jgi:PAS domain S-box-containing protein
MERKRLEKEPEAGSLPRLSAPSIPASTNSPAQGAHAPEAMLDPSAGLDREHPSWIGGRLAMKMPAKTRDLLKRYGLALALSSLVLFLREQLPLREGTAVYQLPLAAVVLSAWYGGRGPGLFAVLICATGILYWLIPPTDSFELPSDYALGFAIFVGLCLLLSEFSAGRRRAGQALRASEARFRTFVDHATDAFFLINEDLSVVDVNRQACESLGYRREELIGMHPRDFDVGLDKPSIDRFAQRAEGGEIVTFETRHRRKDGTTFPVEIRSGTFRQGGKRFYLALVRDITERKLAEESLGQSQAYLTESQRLSHTGSWALDVTSNRYLYTSEEFDRLFGFDPQGEALTREAVLERIHPEDRSTWKRHLEKSLHEKVDTTSQYRIVLRDGTVRHIHTIRHPVVNSAGEVVKLVGTSIDITERKHAEEERDRLRRLEAELAHANRLNTLGELTTSIAHEVSQPLGAMVASAGACARWLATDPPKMAEARSALANIVTDGKRARDVIARIRTLAKRQVPRMDLLDVNGAIAEVLAFTEQELRSHDIVLQTRLDSTLPKVMGDRVQLQQVILNLVKNAIEAMSGVNDRRRELTLVSARVPDGAVVEVRDSGIGLDTHGAERLFEAFYTTKPEGLGIGLSISRSMVEAHGGRLWAAPNEPHGAVFAFSLPVSKAGQS